MPQRTFTRLMGGTLAAAACVATAAWITSRPTHGPDMRPAAVNAPARPEGGQIIASGTPLQPLLDAAPARAVFCLEPGVHDGPLVITHPGVTLWGPRSAVVRSKGTGTTVSVQASGVRLLGFTVDGSGDRADLMDAAVSIRGDGARVEGLRVVHALFGFVAEQSQRIALVGNEVLGDAATPVGLRGDGIRLWETRDSLIASNFLDNCRDVVIWYSPGNRVVDNFVRRSRYGTHFMYGSGGGVEGNRYVENVVSVFIMYSHTMQVRHNVLAANQAEGMGMGAKESGDMLVEGNRFVKNNIGLYLDTSPFRPQDTDTIRNNQFELCDTAVVFHSSEARTAFSANVFRNNQEQVRVEGRGNALGVSWRGNDFDDYSGYDFDRDGFGDVPYELRSASNQLIGTCPDLAYFRGTPALNLLDAVGRVFPLFEASPLLVDPEPRFGSTVRGEQTP